MHKYKPTQELYHSGIKGMKWGVRKQKEKTSDSNETKPLLTEEEKKVHNKKRIKTGAKIATGILAGGLAAASMYKVATSKTLLLGASVGTLLVSRKLSKKKEKIQNEVV